MHFYQRKTHNCVYADDCIIISKEKPDLLSIMQLSQAGPENLIFMDESPISDYLGVEINRLPCGCGLIPTQ